MITRRSIRLGRAVRPEVLFPSLLSTVNCQLLTFPRGEG